MRICILGAGGFIARHIIREFPSSTLLSHKDLNLLDEESVKTYFSERTFDVIIHCASVGGSRLGQDDQSVYSDNVAMFVNVYKHGRYNRLIWFSSGAAENQTPYGRAKKRIEQLIEHDPVVFIIKIWGCFGPDEPAQRLLATGLREGHVIIKNDRLFSFVHVIDVVFVIKCIISGYKQRMIHMVYPENPVLLSEILTMAKIPYTVTEHTFDPPYTGTWNCELLKPILNQRILEYVSRPKA